MTKDRRAFTIAEVVIAMAVIAIMSVCALSVALTSHKLAKNSADTFAMNGRVTDAVELFKASQTVEGYCSALSSYYGAEGIVFTSEGQDVSTVYTATLYFSDVYAIAAAASDSPYYMTLTVTVIDNLPSSLSALAFRQDGRQLTSARYDRGGAV